MSESDSGSALGTLFFYVLFVHPVCAWILAPKRFRKDRALVYAILFLATIALGKMVRCMRRCVEIGVEITRGRMFMTDVRVCATARRVFE